MATLTCTWAQLTASRDGRGSEISYVDSSTVVTFICHQNGLVYTLKPGVPKATFLAHWPDAKPILEIKE